MLFSNGSCTWYKSGQLKASCAMVTYTTVEACVLYGIKSAQEERLIAVTRAAILGYDLKNDYVYVWYAMQQNNFFY